jgi:hypothetical protein
MEGYKMTKTEREFKEMCDGTNNLVFGYVDGEGNITEVDVAEISDFEAIEDFIRRCKREMEVD